MILHFKTFISIQIFSAIQLEDRWVILYRYFPHRWKWSIFLMYHFIALPKKKSFFFLSNDPVIFFKLHVVYQNLLCFTFEIRNELKFLTVYCFLFWIVHRHCRQPCGCCENVLFTTLCSFLRTNWYHFWIWTFELVLLKSFAILNCKFL